MKRLNLAPANSAHGDSQTDDLETKFKAKLHSFSAFAIDFGLRIEPYSDITWPKFRTLPSAMQRDSYLKFTNYYELCVEAVQSGIALNDDRALGWSVLQKFGLRPCSDFFDKLTKDHVLELYNRDLVQIYRNWAFFQISSYSMGDLFVYPWPELYTREVEVTQRLIEQSQTILSGAHKSTMPILDPRHIVVESLSSGKNVLDMAVNYVSPVYDSTGAIAGFFAVSTVQKLGTQTSVSNKSATSKPATSVPNLTVAKQD